MSTHNLLTDEYLTLSLQELSDNGQQFPRNLLIDKYLIYKSLFIKDLANLHP
jgi:hypothetical protein